VNEGNATALKWIVIGGITLLVWHIYDSSTAPNSNASSDGGSLEEDVISAAVGIGTFLLAAAVIL
jgi:hypothetical protein